MLLRHGLFRSHRTGEMIDKRWTLLSYPPRWHYDMLRALDYFARAGAKRDPRLQESIDLLISRRRPDGRWPVQQKHPALVYFNMEKTGGPVAGTRCALCACCGGGIMKTADGKSNKPPREPELKP